jgi:hypothetical protein
MNITINHIKINDYLMMIVLGMIIVFGLRIMWDWFLDDWFYTARAWVRRTYAKLGRKKVDGNN